jgi:hypothetical protein
MARSVLPSRKLGLAILLVFGIAHDALGQNCTVSGGSVTQNGGACTVVPGTVLNPSSTGITANNGQVTADSVTINPATMGAVPVFRRAAGAARSPAPGSR